MVNKTECSRLEQRSVIKFSVAEKCKLCEIYWRMCDAYREAYFSQKRFRNCLNMGLPQRTWSENALVKKKFHYWMTLEQKKNFSYQNSDNNYRLYDRINHQKYNCIFLYRCSDYEPRSFRFFNIRPILIKKGLVSLFNGISTLCRLFNAKAILLEEQ